MLTQLEAVNRCLLALGSAPTNSIEGQVNRDVAAIKAILERARSNVLLEGWAFNKDPEVPMPPASNGEIVVDANVLHIDLSPGVYHNLETLDPVQRGNRLYNRKTRTYIWTTTLTVDITRDLAWDEIPEVIRHYIAATAAEISVTELEGSPEQIQASMKAVVLARRNAVAHKLNTSDATIFDAETDYRIRRRHLRR